MQCKVFATVLVDMKDRLKHWAYTALLWLFAALLYYTVPILSSTWGVIIQDSQEIPTLFASVRRLLSCTNHAVILSVLK